MYAVVTPALYRLCTPLDPRPPTQELFAAQPAAYVGFLSLLTSLAAGEKGAYVVFKLLAAAPSGALFSWQTNLGVMLQYCSRFRPPGTTTQDEGTRAAAVSMPEVDALALAAFARLLARVVEQGAREHVGVWLREMEEAVGVNPLWELLLQLLCYPVPSVCLVVWGFVLRDIAVCQGIPLCIQNMPLCIQEMPLCIQKMPLCIKNAAFCQNEYTVIQSTKYQYHPKCNCHVSCSFASSANHSNTPHCLGPTPTPPQNLKAALFDAVAAIATAQPDSAPALWDRLLAASVVGVAPAGSSVPVIRYDLAYQLNEIQARAEDYQEVLSFVGLLNALWGAAKHPPGDAGRPYAHFSRFVREDVLGTLAQRAFRDPRQRWELATACLTHLQRTLDTWAAQGAVVQQGQRAPGLDVLLDMLGRLAHCR